MSLEIPISIHELQVMLGQHAKAARLAADQGRKTASRRTGVPESTLKKFENQGEISLRQFLKILRIYGCMVDPEQLFPSQPFNSIDEVIESIQPGRSRGQT